MNKIIKFFILIALSIQVPSLALGECTEEQLADLILAGISKRVIDLKCKALKQNEEKSTDDISDPDESEAEEEDEEKTELEDDEDDEYEIELVPKNTGKIRAVTAIISNIFIDTETLDKESFKDQEVVYNVTLFGAEVFWDHHLSSKFLYGGGSLSESTDIKKYSGKGDVSVASVNIDYNWFGPPENGDYWSWWFGLGYHAITAEYEFEEDSQNTTRVAMDIQGMDYDFGGGYNFSNWFVGYAHTAGFGESTEFSEDNRNLEIDTVNTHGARFFVAYTF